VAAVDIYGGAVICIDFGTATTYDAVSDKGELLGCAIAPGIDISLDALYQRADALRRVELLEPRSVVGRNTVEAIQAGAVYGFAGQVDGIVDRILEAIGQASVVATGGLAATIAPYTRTIEHIEPWLTLHGLRLIYEKNP
jgi:type III pantothenate kinase